MAGDTASIDIPLIRPDGALRPTAEIDAAVLEAVRGEVAAGHKVLLQTMESSKLGWRAPSDACVAAIADRWPDVVQIVIDTCQLRIGRDRLNRLLNRGAIVLITGSKFFMGPGFSGASLIPRLLGDRLAEIDDAPPGAFEYLARLDMPARWQGLRSRLSPSPNFGAWLRWEAALD